MPTGASPSHRSFIGASAESRQSNAISVVKTFSDVPARANAEEALRKSLRLLIQTGRIVPTEEELALSIGSPFDIDEFVWKMWHEHVLTNILRDLRHHALFARGQWETAFNNSVASDFSVLPPSLISFYRAVRTIEHALVGDLAGLESGGGRIDRTELLSLIEGAYKDLAVWCPRLKWTDPKRASSRHLTKTALLGVCYCVCPALFTPQTLYRRLLT